AAVGVLFGDGDDEAQVGFDQFALGLIGVHVALDHLALGALQLTDEDAGVDLDFFQVGLAIFLLAAVLLLQLVAAAGLVLLFERAYLALERAHGVDGFVDLVEQALALQGRVLEFADDARNQHLFTGDGPASAARGGGLSLGGGGLLLLQRGDFLLVLGEGVDAGDGSFDARQHDLFGELLVVEDDHFFDVADAALKVLAEGHDFANHDGRTGDGFEDAHLAALDALGDFDFALARQQGDGAHLAQVHAHRIVSLFQR